MYTSNSKLNQRQIINLSKYSNFHDVNKYMIFYHVMIYFLILLHRIMFCSVKVVSGILAVLFSTILVNFHKRSVNRIYILLANLNL
jgi:hypothetical protein